MPVSANAPGRRDGRLRRAGSELYLGALVTALILAAGAGMVATISYLTSFVSWVALND